MDLSVIIRTHNPRVDYLTRTLDALKTQTLPKDQWELLLIDNASKNLLAGKWDLSWHPHASHVREEQLGSTYAQLRGIRESASDLIVFVDDDNVLFPDYLMECIQIAKMWTVLGAWGGQQFPEFEDGEPIETWKREFWTGTLRRDAWSNNYDRATVPIGAGVCIRRQVALKYAGLAGSDPLRQRLGRTGAGILNCAEDYDMAFVACDLGLGVGRFVSLKLYHLMPKSRTSDEYLLKLSEGFGYSLVILDALRGTKTHQLSHIDRIVNFYKRLRIPPMRRRMDAAYEAGRTRAINELNMISSPTSK
jgi:glycosyltransferase involved in cell wall biosynthesis